MPLLSKHLKGDVPYGRETGIATNRHLAGIDNLTEITVIHNGTIDEIGAIGAIGATGARSQEQSEKSKAKREEPYAFTPHPAFVEPFAVLFGAESSSVRSKIREIGDRRSETEGLHDLSSISLVDPLA